MDKKKYTMKTAYLAVGIVILLMLLLQVIILTANNIREAENTTKAYLDQTEAIIEKNKHEEEALLASLKEEYTVLAKAVSYYLDHNPEAVNDEQELNKICSLMSIDEIHIFDENGIIVSSTSSEYLGYSFDSGEQISYFKPMLSDKTLTMCQDVTPNTAEGNPMVYAITWNEAGTSMVQVGIKPVRLMKELESNKIQSTIDDIALDKKMTILVADASTLDIVASKNNEYIAKNLSEVTSLSENTINRSFYSKVRLLDKAGYYFCRAGFTKDYCICVFMSHEFFQGRTVESLLVVFLYLSVAFFVIITIIRRLLSSLEKNNQYMRVFESMSEIY